MSQIMRHSEWCHYDYPGKLGQQVAKLSGPSGKGNSVCDVGIPITFPGRIIWSVMLFMFNLA